MTALEMAQVYFDKIPNGPREPLDRPQNEAVDRALRSLINKANKSGDVILSPSGGGYYRYMPGSEEADHDLRIYLAQELHRARDILYKRLKMKEAAQKKRVGEEV